jgi:TolB protein
MPSTSAGARRRLLLALGLVPGVLLSAPAAAQAAWPGLDGRLSITQEQPGINDDVYAFSRLGDESERLTLTRNDEEQSSWSPGGRLIAYKRSNEVFVRDVTTADPPTRLTVKETAEVFNTQPGWSPDGAQIVFRSNRALPSTRAADVWIMNADGSGQRRLVSDDPGQVTDERYPTLSPDGTRVLFTSDRSGSVGIWSADARTGGDVRLVYDGPLADSAPAWSPDGSRIAFEMHPPDLAEAGDVYTMRADGSQLRQLTTDPAHDEGPAWSPDGTMIAFTSERDEPLGDTWLMNADGSEQANLTRTPLLEESPDWQPLPFPEAVGRPGARRDVCGDLSLAKGGAASIQAVKVPCRKARRVAAAWTAGADTGRFSCTASPHSFDQVVVSCEHRRPQKGLAFVYRTPAS